MHILLKKISTQTSPLTYNALFVLTLMFSRKLIICQKAFSIKLLHFLVFDNGLENEIEGIF